MTYSLLNSVFIGLAIWFAAIAIVMSTKRGVKFTTSLWWTFGITLVIMMITTAVFDNVIIGVGLVAYDPSTLLGSHIGLAPLEDFGYTLAAVIILPVLWILLGTRKKR